MGLWQEKALFAGKIIYKILLVVFKEPPDLFSVLAHTLDFTEKSLAAQRELCSWVAVSLLVMLKH